MRLTISTKAELTLKFISRLSEAAGKYKERNIKRETFTFMQEYYNMGNF